MYVTTECGQRWYRPRSWYHRTPRKTYYPKFRKLGWDGETVGWAFGPLMLLKGDKSNE